MAEAMLRLLDNPSLARELGETARRTIGNRYSLDRMVASTEALYDRLLSRKHRRAA
jgi:glycosyltransferase involved in cell wall biosynthesis